MFAEAWHAQALAIADSMVKAGHFSAVEWAEALGAELKHAESMGRPDTAETYYDAVVIALERLCERRTEMTTTMLERRKAAWESAYRNTPHGKPVRLSAAEHDMG